jgi:beta-lactam-binding protein with PASTA domain
VVRVHFPGAPSGTVIAQSPSPNARDAASPKISLLLAARDNAPIYVMPNFAGRTLAEANKIVEDAGLTVSGGSKRSSGAAARIVVKQYPLPGQKVSAGTTVYFDISH